MKRDFIFALAVGCFLITAVSLLGCATVKTPKVVYFNDSEKVYPGNAFKDVCVAVNFDCVVMSKGLFRSITNVDPGEKVFRLIYE